MILCLFFSEQERRLRVVSPHPQGLQGSHQPLIDQSSADPRLGTAASRCATVWAFCGAAAQFGLDYAASDPDRAGELGGGRAAAR